MADINKTIKDLDEQIAWIQDNDFHKFPGWGHAVLAMKDAIELLKEQPKWIPVAERKPKSMANKVIVYAEHEDLTPQIGYGHYEKFKGVEMWYNLETQEQFSKHGYTVTHWMPMPKSPDGKRLILD